MNPILAVARFDAAIVRCYLKPLGMFLVVLALLTFLNGPMTAIPIFAFFATIVASYPFAISERDRTDILLAAMPITRRSIVFGRYVSAVVDFVALFVLGVAVALLIQVAKGDPPVDAGDAVAITVASFLFYALMIAVQFPLYFRFGYAKARLANIIPIAIIGAVAGFAMAGGADGLAGMVESVLTPLGISLMFLAGVALLGGSLAYTVRAYPRHDV